VSLAACLLLQLDRAHPGVSLVLHAPSGFIDIQTVKSRSTPFIKLVYDFAASSTVFVAAADAELGPNFTHVSIAKFNN